MGKKFSFDVMTIAEVSLVIPVSASYPAVRILRILILLLIILLCIRLGKRLCLIVCVCLIVSTVLPE